MTPELRASKIIGAAAMARFPMWIDIEKQIADAIRAAENDVLERAAAKIKGEAEPQDDDEEAGLAGMRDYYVSVIRGLKHKDAG